MNKPLSFSATCTPEDLKELQAVEPARKLPDNADLWELLAGDTALCAILNAGSEAIVGVDARGRIVIFNHCAEHIFGCSAASMRGRSLRALLPKRFRRGHPQHLRSFAQAPEVEPRLMGFQQVRGLRADGREVELECVLSRMVLHQQPVLIACLRDVTERSLADDRLRLAQTQLRALTKKLMAQEKTLVKGLAQVLHDQLGQTLAAIRLTHETILALQGEHAPANIARLQSHMGALVGTAVEQVRQVLTDLRPPLLEQHGLMAALDNELRNRSTAQPALHLSLHVPPEVAPLRWPVEVEMAAFMVAREALENAFRHAHGSELSISIEGSAVMLGLRVTDNGVGLGVEAAPHFGHLGLLGMHERAMAVGATLTLGPAQPQGTQVCFDWEAAA